ncbi:hypothetical protein IKF73_01860 [Candidatus Saccharibacteria bacterium]|nr:hypothetical protein [Candidatus Saccharibacteria bacterium]
MFGYNLSLYVGAPVAFAAVIYMIVVKCHERRVRRDGWNVWWDKTGGQLVRLLWRSVGVGEVCRFECTGLVGGRLHLYVCIEGCVNTAALLPAFALLCKKVSEKPNKADKKRYMQEFCTKGGHKLSQFSRIEIELLNSMRFKVFRWEIKPQDTALAY